MAWNVDPDFGHTLDCLLVAYLMEAGPKALTRYFGPEGLAVFRARHLGTDTHDLPAAPESACDSRCTSRACFC